MFLLSKREQVEREAAARLLICLLPVEVKGLHTQFGIHSASTLGS